MKLNTILMIVLSGLLFSCTDNDSASPAPDTSNSIFYVAPNASGNGDGMSEDNAADFLNLNFWKAINQSLSENAVTVNFLDGNYSRAYTEKPLVFDNFGNADNLLTLQGGEGVLFDVPVDHRTKSYLIDFKGAQNVHIKAFHFSGDGEINYTMRFTKSKDETTETKNILIEGCTWKNMGGIIYGATGCQFETTHHITYQNCTFKQIGLNGGSHMIYNAYSPTYIQIIDSHFEDCTGDYVRFRDNADFGLVRNCTFIRNPEYPDRFFISVPVFNSREPVGDEYLATNYAFTGNQFLNKAYTNTASAIAFYHSGFSPPEWQYLLNEAEGKTLKSGTPGEKRQLLQSHFGIDADKIRIQGNEYSVRVARQVSLYTHPNYGAESRGFSGWGNISNILNNQSQPFSWE